MVAYYNEIDPFAAAWLRELINGNHIAPGYVDERDIRDVRPSDLELFDQCHFFAGIGGWSLALRQAGWSDNHPVWTGSCPCQPFSTAGRGDGASDERHLWPAFFWLIRQCNPAIVFGEQVASKLGREWLSGVFTDLENMGYAAAGADLCAASIGAYHIRQRLYWVADSNCQRRDGQHSLQREGWCDIPEASGSRQTDWVADSNGSGPQGWVVGRNSTTERTPGKGRLGDQDTIWARCRDGKWRAVEPGTFPLADDVPARVGRLRGYGNAIVPPLAAQFIKAVM